jgi:hypothetical protein
LKVTLEGSDVVEAALLEDVGNVAGGEDDDGVAVFPDFLVGPAVEVRGGDQDAELAVAEPGDEPACLADANAVARCVAFGLERELHRDRVGGGAEEVVADGVASAVAPWPGDVDPVHVRAAQTHQVGGELLEIMRALLDMLVYQVQQGPVHGQRLLGFTGAGNDRGRREQRLVAAGFHPGAPRRRAAVAECPAGGELVDPRS